MQKKIYLENTIEQTKKRLQRAEALTSLLADEGKRWIETVKDLEIEIVNLIGDVFISSAQISYCGPFTGQFRNILVQKWIDNLIQKKIPKNLTD